MGVVSQAADEGLGLERLGNVLVDGNGAERGVGRGDALGHGDNVGHDAEVVNGEPLAAAAEARHDLVRDHYDVVLSADRAHALEVALGGDDDAVGASHGLEDHGRDVVGVLLNKSDLRTKTKGK